MLLRSTRTLLLVLMLLAAARLTLVATDTEIGWELTRSQWQDAFLELVGDEHSSIGKKTPAEQAKFWLKEVEHIVKEDRDSASIRMGAAWVLDSPVLEFRDFIRQRTLSLGSTPIGSELDTKSISKENAQFSDICQDRCLQLAKSATQLAPDDVRWWRMRALLLFDGDPIGSEKPFGTRSTEWLSVLDECKKHDSENALYDYLAALQLWQSSASYDIQFGSGAMISAWLLTVANPATFDMATDRFIQGQSKPFLAIGELGYPSIAGFLEKTQLGKVDQSKVALSRQVTIRQSRLVSYLWRWQNVRADKSRASRDKQGEMAILRQNLKLFEQAIAPEETSALSALTVYSDLREHNFGALDKLVEDDPTMIDPEEFAAIKQRNVELQDSATALRSALHKLETETYPKKHTISWLAFFTYVATVSTALLLAIAVILLLVKRLLSSIWLVTPKFGVLRHGVVWVLGYGFSFLMLGMVPAQLISLELQRHALIACAWVALIGIVAILGWFIFKQSRIRKFRFRLVSLFALMTGSAIFLSLWPVIGTSFDDFNGIQSDYSLPEKGFSGIDATTLRTMAKIGKGTWQWASLQWLSHPGLYVGLFASLTMSTIWYMWRGPRLSNRRFHEFWTQSARTKWAELFQFSFTTSFTAAMCWLFLYLTIAPTAIRFAEAKFQHEMSYCRDPASYWAEIRDTQVKIREYPHQN